MIPRVLFCAESSNIASGYGAYSKEVMSRLSQRSDIEVAEFAGYESPVSLAQNPKSWRCYPIEPHPQDQAQVQAYESNPNNHFGEYIFEKVLLDFKPTHVIDIQDVWNYEFKFRSPFRDFYSHLIMPAIDNSIQHGAFLHLYRQANLVLGYTDWGLDVLKSYGLSNTFKTVSPCGSDDFYKDYSLRDGIRNSVGISEDAVLYGMVCRNQPRKRLPELIKGFAKWQKESKSNAYLFLHTTGMDSWDFEELILEYDIGNRVFLTYVCNNCRSVEVSKTKGEVAYCAKCKQPNSLRMPTTRTHVSTEELRHLYNIMDFYVQYANIEGYGIPLIEAIKCEIPIAAVDSTAMGEIIEKSFSMRIDVAGFNKEHGSGRDFPVPSESSLIEFFDKTYVMSKAERNQRARQAKMFYGNNTWDKVVGTWLEAIHMTKPKLDWNAPKRQYNLNINHPNFQLTNKQFARYLILEVLQEPKLCNSYLEARLIKDLDNGFSKLGMSGKYYNEDIHRQFQSFTKEIAVQHFGQLLEEKIFWEEQRCQSCL